MTIPVYLFLAIAASAVVAFASLGILYARGRVRRLEDYITARGSMGLPAATATFISSVMGSWILFSPAEAGVLWGLPAVIGYGIGSSVPFLIYLIIGPRARRLMPEGHSVTEFALVRYGRGMYSLVLVITVFYMFIFLTAELTAISLTFNLLAGIPLLATALLVGLATVAYTAYGGIRASVFTDSLQTLVLLPLLALAFLGAMNALGGPGEIYRGVSASTPELLRLDHIPGIYFAIYVTIAITGANMFNQGYWQRFFTSQDDTVLRKGLAVAAFAVFPMVVLAGIFGIVAQGLGVVDHASVALFSLIVTLLPEWVVILILLVILALIMSTLDTLLNGIASIFAADLPHLARRWKGARILKASRVVTLLLALVAISIASFGFSVLTLFLIADLVCTASAFPALYGLYSERISGRAALASSILGMAIGAPLFVLGLTSADPSTAALRFLLSFGLALLSSTVAALLLSVRGPRYDLDRLAVEIREVGD
jgi:Na+/proline symporter